MRLTTAAIFSWALAVGALTAAAGVASAQLPTDARPTSAASGGSIVFLAAPELPATVRAGLIDALEAQLTGERTTLHWELMSSVGTDLRAAIDQGKPAAQRHAAAGVFWLDASGAEDWLLYLMDAAGERILVRRIEGAAAAPGATIEAVAVIVRESAVALSAGQPIAMETVREPAAELSVEPPPTAPTATPEPTVVPPPIATPTSATVPVVRDAPGWLRFALAYAGSPLETNVPWQSGLDPQLAAVTPSGSYVGIAYTLLPTLTVRGSGFALGLDRRPIRVFSGAALTTHRLFRLDAELSVVVDIATRSTLSAPASGDVSDDQTRFIVGGGLSARFNWTPQANTDVFLAIGAQGFLNRFDYAIEQNDTQVTLLSPWKASPVASVGVAFRP